MSGRSVTSWILCCALRVASAQSPPAGGSPDADPQFAIRADPKFANEINRVLREVARPTEVSIPKDTAVGTFLKERCGSVVPPDRAQSAVRSSGVRVDTLSFTPCLQYRTTVPVAVRKHDTLAEIATRLGLSPGSEAGFARFRGSLANLRRLQSTEPVRESDTIVVPQAPQWTVFETDRSKISDSGELVTRLARALGCHHAEVNECLLRHDVILLQQHSPYKEAGIAEPSETALASLAILSPQASDRAIATLRDSGGKRSPVASTAILAGEERPPPIPIVPQSVLAPPTASPAPEGATPPPALAAAPAAATSAILSTKPQAAVADGQWPYDITLVKLLLTSAIQAHPEIVPTVVGIADGGLGSSGGKPLPANVFTTTPGEPLNGYAGDLIGAGLARDIEPRNGDVGICPPNQDAASFVSWPADTLIAASHGTVVSSIAAALPLRSSPTLQKALPALTFFRLSVSNCSAPPVSNVQPQQAFDAIQYLDTRALIVNVSYIDSSTDPFLAFALKGELDGQEKLLVVPAGDQTVDLDATYQCLPCLANPGWRISNAIIGRRVLVIGTATIDLRRAAFSGRGPQSVHLYAPGEPIGALDILGGDASGFDPATSYSAPYASMAAALMRSLGVSDVDNIAHRLRAASWPLIDDDPDGTRFDQGIIDITKVAAVRTYAVEVLEKNAAGFVVRRTYVGQLSNRLDQLAFCAKSISEATVQAVRLGAPDSIGDRRVAVHLRLPGITPAEYGKCHPTGSVTLIDPNGVSHTFPLDTVTEILAPWMHS